MIKHSATTCPICRASQIRVVRRGRETKSISYRDTALDRYMKSDLCNGFRIERNQVQLSDMSQCEREAMNSLPDTFTVYRGYATAGEIDSNRLMAAQSWTTNESVAKKFVQHHELFLENEMDIYECNSTVVSKVVHKSDVIAVLLGKDEAEILLSK